MKKLFLIGIVLIAVLYLAAQITLEKPHEDGVIRLRWATDPNPARLAQIKLFSQLHPNIKIVAEPAFAQRVIVQCATGVGPDVIDVYSIEDMVTYVQAGVLLDLTDFAEAQGFGLDKTYPAVAAALTVEGRQYRFPCSVGANCVIYNKAVFDDHGVAYPRHGWTYEDFIAAASQIKDKPSRSGPTHIPLAKWSTTVLFNDLLIGHGGRYFSDDGLTSLLDSPAALAAIELYHDLLFVHDVMPTLAEAAAISSEGGWGGGSLNWFSQGKAAMIMIGRWYTVLTPNYPQLQGRLGAVQLPRHKSRASAGSAMTRAAGINAKTSKLPQAQLFLRFLASTEYGELIVADGDSLPPNPNLARNGADLVNSTISDPCFQQPFVDAVQNSRPLDVSGFIDAALVNRWLTERIEQVENQLVRPKEAFGELAQQINDRIKLNLQRRPDLRRKYEAVTGRQYQPQPSTTRM